MNKIFVSVMMGLITLALVACGDVKQADIVTTMFPQYDFARHIVGEKMTVSLLAPPGVEPHEFEASSKDMVAIKNAKLFIFTSFEIDTWIKDVDNIGGPHTIILNLSETYLSSDHIHAHDDEPINDNDHTDSDDDHDHSELHYWTDPTTAIQLIEVILAKIIEIDPVNAKYYQDNAHDYIHELEELHEKIDHFFQNPLYKNSTIFFAGHNAMEAFGERYHINIVSLFPDFKPDQDLTSAQLVAFIQEIKFNQVRYLFIEELVEPRAAMTILNELAKEYYTLELLELHGYHNITKSEMDAGVTYLDLLLRNFEHLKLVLEGD